MIISSRRWSPLELLHPRRPYRPISVAQVEINIISSNTPLPSHEGGICRCLSLSAPSLGAEPSLLIVQNKKQTFIFFAWFLPLWQTLVSVFNL